MSTKMGFWRWALASTAILIATSPADARVIDPTGITTQHPAAIVDYPKLKVDLNTCQGGACSLTPEIPCSIANGNADCTGCNLMSSTCRIDPTVACTSAADCPGAAVDTLVQLTNTSEFLTKVLCYYTNANGHCSNAEQIICNPFGPKTGPVVDICPPGGLCIPGWQEPDFHLTLTKRQPISWSVNSGLSQLPLATIPGQGNPPQFNEGFIPPAPEVPFTGDLLCIEVDVATELPSDRNDFKGEATIVKTIAEQIDAAKYNAIGIKAIEGRQDEVAAVLNIGGPDAEYGVFNDVIDEPRFAGCPNVWTLDHFFDNANVETHDHTVRGRVTSDLTIVPCERDFLLQSDLQKITTIQFLIFNEFEQRFSASTKLSCYKEIRLSDIDTQPGPAQDSFSIFSVGVQGSQTGMTRVRSVPGPNVDGYDGRTIMLVLGENWAAGICGLPGSSNSPGIGIGRQLCRSDADCPEKTTCIAPATKSTASNVQWQGSRVQGDKIKVQLPP